MKKSLTDGIDSNVQGIALSKARHPMWNPSTAEVYDKYLAREVTLCVTAREKNPRLVHENSLFSFDTWMAASNRILMNGGILG